MPACACQTCLSFDYTATLGKGLAYAGATGWSIMVMSPLMTSGAMDMVYSWLVHQLVMLWHAVSDLQLVHLLCSHRLLRKLLKWSWQNTKMRSEKLRTPAKLQMSKWSSYNCINQAQHHP